ncbi:MAG: hypothetical protein IK005_12740 [Paludibacteraceae bacterium]|nr:hypothetical protein [Paludibacteraceae bacterium]
MKHIKHISFVILLLILSAIAVITDSFIIGFSPLVFFGLPSILLWQIYKRLDDNKRRKFILILAILLLIISKTESVWENILSLITHYSVEAGFVALIGVVIGAILFVCALIGIILWKAYILILKRKMEKDQVIELGLFSTILVLFVLPFNINLFEKPVFLEAYRELPGGGDHFVFYEDGTLKEKYYGLAVDIDNGHYHLSNDTTIVIDDLDDIVDNQSTLPPKYAIISLENRRLYVYIRGRKIPYIITKSSLLQE